MCWMGAAKRLLATENTTDKAPEKTAEDGEKNTVAKSTKRGHDIKGAAELLSFHTERKVFLAPETTGLL